MRADSYMSLHVVQDSYLIWGCPPRSLRHARTSGDDRAIGLGRELEARLGQFNLMGRDLVAPCWRCNCSSKSHYLRHLNVKRVRPLCSYAGAWQIVPACR
jgi:hypothetical protein